MIELVVALNNARVLANDHAVTAPQSGVYGEIAHALKKTLGYILGHPADVDAVYQSLLDGCTFPEAMDALAS